MPVVEEHLTTEDEYDINKELLNTIKIPRNINLLQGKLPKSQYEEEKLEELDRVIGLFDKAENRTGLSGPHSNSVTNVLEKVYPHEQENLLMSMPSTTKHKEKEPHKDIYRPINNDDQSSIYKKKRINPRTTPMNLELMSVKPKKYPVYRNLNSQSRKIDGEEASSRRNNNIHEKYLKRAQEVEVQEKK